MGEPMGLRKRTVANLGNEQFDQRDDDFVLVHSESAAAAANKTDPPSHSPHDISKTTKSTRMIYTQRLWKNLFYYLNGVACLAFLLGFLMRIQLHTGEECQMTYSWRQFLELDMSSAIANHPNKKMNRHYKLYKFVDQRDLRYQSLLYVSQPLQGSAWCGGDGAINNTTIVLYIPGHWGSYSQSRSIGAHGIQLTGPEEDQRSRLARVALASHAWHGKASQENKFTYDVYSVDFAEQGGALHGQFLRSQSDFVASAVENLLVRRS